jgi:hypothetical protein
MHRTRATPALIALAVIALTACTAAVRPTPTATPTATPIATASATPLPTAQLAYPALICAAAATVALIAATPPQELAARVTEFRALVASDTQAVLALPQPLDWHVILRALGEMGTGLDLVAAGNFDAAHATFADATDNLDLHKYGPLC